MGEVFATLGNVSEDKRKKICDAIMTQFGTLDDKKNYPVSVIFGYRTPLVETVENDAYYSDIVDAIKGNPQGFLILAP